MKVVYRFKRQYTMYPFTLGILASQVPQLGVDKVPFLAQKFMIPRMTQPITELTARWMKGYNEEQVDGVAFKRMGRWYEGWIKGWGWKKGKMDE